MRRQYTAMAATIAAMMVGVAMATPSAMAANGTIPIDAAHFPDTNLRVVIANTWDAYPKDGKLTMKERNAVDEIRGGAAYTIKSAKGIEYFPNLKRLYLYQQLLTSIDLTHNPKLQDLDLSWNKLSKIDLSKNTELRDLDLGCNKLVSINVSKNTKLTEFDFGGNPLLRMGPIAPAVTLYSGSDYTTPYQAYSGILNLKSAAPGIDLSRISNVRGGKIENGIVMADKLNGMVTYHYTYDYTHRPLEAQIKFTPSIWFSDVNVYSTPHAMDIQWMGDTKISTGWLVNGKYVFRGMDTVKRQDMAAFLRRLAARFNVANAKNYKPSAADWRRFRDVNGNTPHAEDILWLAKAGITTGWNTPRGAEFRGWDTVKRQDMAAFLKRLAAKANKGQNIKGKSFVDVNRSTPHWQEIQWLGGAGISTGWNTPQGAEFRGWESVRRQDMAAFIHRLNYLLS